ncbi:GNAT family N-acetyltransferase [Micromonospora sp. NPDC004704]
MPSENLTRITEFITAELNFQYVEIMSERGRTELGLTGARIGGGAALAMRNDPTDGGWNKTIGLGFTEPVSAKLIGEVVDFHREHGSPSAQIQLAPEVLPPDWDDIRAAYGLTAGDATVKLVGDVDDFKPGTTDLRVGRVGVEDAEEWASMLEEVFGLPEQFNSSLVAAVGRPDFLTFAAWDGDTMVAGAGLFLYGEFASLHNGATRESHRNRGAQSALLTARAQAAVEAGVRWLFSDTGKPAEGESNPSLNNMIRSGLTPMYNNQSWIWRPEGNTTAG